MAMRKSMALVALSVLSAIGSPAVATVVYTDLPSFLAQVQPGYYLEDFTGLGPWEFLGTDRDFGSGDYAWHAHASDYQLVSYEAGTLSIGQSMAHIELTFGNAVTAVGGYFNAYDGAWWSDIEVELTLADSTVYRTGATTDWDFVGFVSPGVPIVSLDVYCVGDAPVFPTLDDVYTGSAVPEPATMAMMGIAILAAMKTARRQAA